MNEKNWIVISHLSALAIFVFPFGNIIGPLIVWLLKRAEFASVEREAKESLNFQITVSLAILVAFFLPIRIFAVSILVLADIVYIVLGSIEASNKGSSRYPLNLRLIV